MDEDINLTAESIEWEAPEFLYRHKTVFWYWISAIIAVIIFAFAWWQKNIFFPRRFFVGYGKNFHLGGFFKHLTHTFALFPEGNLAHCKFGYRLTVLVGL